MYDQVATSQITLTNTGHVGFEFVAIDMDPALAEHPKPGVPVVIPHRVSHSSFDRLLRQASFNWLRFSKFTKILEMNYQ